MIASDRNAAYLEPSRKLTTLLGFLFLCFVFAGTASWSVDEASLVGGRGDALLAQPPRIEWRIRCLRRHNRLP